MSGGAPPRGAGGPPSPEPGRAAPSDVDPSGGTRSTPREGGPAPPGTARPRARSWRRRAGWSLAALVALLALGLVGLSQTSRGHALVLERVLDRLRASLAGELSVEGIRSGTLLRGATLTGVRLDAMGGRRFLEADSLVLRYSLLDLVTGGAGIGSATMFGLRLEISRYPGDDYLNVHRVLATREEPGDSSSSLPRIELGRVGIRGGVVEVLIPLPDGSGRARDGDAADAGEAGTGASAGPASGAPEAGPGMAGVAKAPDGSPLRRIAFTALDVDLEDAVLAPRPGVRFEAGLASLSMIASILEDPLVLHEAFGHFELGPAGLEVTDGAFRLPSTLLRGRVAFGPTGPETPWRFSASLDADGWGDLADLAWLDERVPPGRFRGGAEVSVGPSTELRLRGLRAELEASSVAADGRLRVGERTSFESLRLTLSPLSLARLHAWGGPELPLEGWLSGQVTLSGTTDDLRATGRLTLVPAGFGGEPTTAEFSGVLHAGADFGATDLDVRLDPLNYRLVEAFAPGSGVTGRGSGTLELDGRAAEGLVLVADFAHQLRAGVASRVLARGLLLRPPDGTWTADLRGELSPLSLGAFAHLVPDLAPRGDLQGPLRVTGPVDRLRITGDLMAAGGTLLVEATVNLLDPGSAYSLEADGRSLMLSSVTSRLPDPTEWTGRLALAGSGFSLDSLLATAELSALGSRVGALAVDTVTASLRAGEGVLVADTLFLAVAGVRARGSGQLGMSRRADGRARVAFETTSLVGLRPYFMGDSIIVRDSLNLLEEDFLRVQGIDPDTLPRAEDVRMAGALRGTAELRGAFDDFDLDLAFDVVGGAYGHNSVDSARVALAAAGLPATTGAWDVEVDARGVTWLDRSFDNVVMDATMTQRRGEGSVLLARRSGEEYAATGAFALDSLGGDVRLTEASARIDDLAWTLSRPAGIAWTETSLTVDSLEVDRVGSDPMRVLAGGTLAWGGASDFRLDVRGMHIEQLIRAVQLQGVDASGHLDLSVTVAGPAEDPLIAAAFEIEEPRYDSIRLTRVGGSLDYADRSADVRAEVWDQTRTALTAEGTVPLNLALTDVEERRLDEPMSLEVRADSLEASLAFAYLRSLADVAGTVSADFRVRGTSLQPEPSGTVELADAAWTIEALGVRHTGINGVLSLQPNRIVGVSLTGSAVGTSQVTGTLELEPLTNPSLDLSISFARFVAVQRSDIEGVISGEFTLRGSYRRPVAAGSLVADEATLFVDEFARNADVIDLRDPRLTTLGVDTTVFVSQPILGDLRNPFLDSLRVDIDLSVPRNTWIRSDEMDVEMGGELIVAYDRSAADLVLVGELQALRGSYLLYGRTFEVSEGTVSFIGTPGVNPRLDISAISRIRRQEVAPLEVVANVEGTLIHPVVTLTSDEPGLAQADLVSYLVFGVPSGQLVATGRAGLLEAGFGAGVTAFTETLANQVGTVLSQELGLGLDYVSYSFAGSAALSEGIGSGQLEAGRYLGDDVFVALILRNPSDASGAGESTTGASVLRGIRIEWALSDNYYGELFVEDRFLRSALAGQGSTAIDDGDKIVGFLVFREWGY